MTNLVGDGLHACHVAPISGRYVGGPLSSVPSLCGALVRAGVPTTLLALDLPEHAALGVKVLSFRRCEAPLIRELSISPSLRRTMHRIAKEVQVMHCHGLWQFPTIYPARAVSGTTCQLVVSPRGSLAREALGISRTRKRIAWRLAQGRVYEKAACIHTTSEAEAEDVRRMGLRNPVAVIPNGVSLPVVATADGKAQKRVKSVVYLGRLHVIKGLETLLQAWATVEREDSAAELIMAGDGERSYRLSLEELGRSLGLRKVSYIGAIEGSAKEKLISEASLVVLPSKSENFGMVVAEALAAGTPAMVSRGAPWSELSAKGCGWWVELDAVAWAAALASAVRLPADDLAEMGRRGREWMAAEYSWDSIAERMSRTYRWLTGDTERPEWVHLA